MNSNGNNIILIRGLPGSGKTELANLLSESGKHPVFSVDQYFTDNEGNYDFDFSKNHLAYAACQNNVLASMKVKEQLILVDNTFTLDWEMEPYFKMASDYDYRIFVITVENYHGNSNQHGVSEEQMEKMAAKFKVKLLP